MGLFYCIFNVLTPIILLVYFSLLHFKQQKTLPYGRWAAMMITLYVMDWISWIFQQSYIVYLIDLIIKIIIPFLPLQMNTLLERQISNLHLQIWFKQLRTSLINLVCSFYIQLTQYLLCKMQVSQSQQFIQRLCRQLKITQNQSIQFIQSDTKQKSNTFNQTLMNTFNETATNPLYETATNTLYETRTKDLFFQQKININKDKQYTNAHQQSSQDPYHSKAFSNNKLREKKQSSRYENVIDSGNMFPIEKRESQNYTYPELKDLTSNPPNLRQLKYQSGLYQKQYKRGQFLNQSPTSNLYHHLLPTQKQNQLNDNFLNIIGRDSLIEGIRVEVLKQNIKGNSQNENIVNTFNQVQPPCSDNFYQSQPYYNQKILQTKVEVILQIGTGTTARLEIYNIELYSNNELRILSLYQREFQTHKLHAIKSLSNGYHELIFLNGKIHSRKCKFRGGNLQPFFKYLI